MLDVADALRFAQFSKAEEWNAYRCDNAVQTFECLTIPRQDGSEIQICSISNLAAPYDAGHEIFSLVLSGGCEHHSTNDFYIHNGSIEVSCHYAVAGSVIRTTPGRERFISASKHPVLLLRVFSGQKDWSLHQSLDDNSRAVIFENAMRAIRNSITWSSIHRG